MLLLCAGQAVRDFILDMAPDATDEQIKNDLITGYSDLQGVGFSTNYAKNFLPVSLFLGYSVAACICCPKCALVLGNGSERFCASRPLLGSYVHQESMLNKCK